MLNKKGENNMDNTSIVKLEMDLVITPEDMNDIMLEALTGGIAHWCGKVDAVGEPYNSAEYIGKYASEQISKDGQLILYDKLNEKSHILNKEKFLKGLKLYLENLYLENPNIRHPYGILDTLDNKLRIDTCLADALVCDMIIQYALFGKVIYEQ